MCPCIHTPMCVCKHASMQACKHASIQASKHPSIQAWKRASMQGSDLIRCLHVHVGVEVSHVASTRKSCCREFP